MQSRAQIIPFSQPEYLLEQTGMGTVSVDCPVFQPTFDIAAVTKTKRYKVRLDRNNSTGLNVRSDRITAHQIRMIDFIQQIHAEPPLPNSPANTRRQQFVVRPADAANARAAH